MGRYTSRDTVSIRNDIINYVKSRTDKITDFNESEVAMVLFEVLSGVADMLNFYLDNQANETFLMTARQPKNIRGILETINYKLSTIGTAEGVVTFRIQGVSSDTFRGKVTIPKFTALKTNTYPSYPYLLLDEVVLSYSEPERNAKVVQGKLKTVEVSRSTLLKDYKYYLSEGNIPLEYVWVDQEGSSWERIDDSFLELNGGQKFSVHSDADGRVYIMFTYNYADYLPVTDNEKVKISYILSEGLKGQAEPYAISIIDGEVVIDNLNGPSFDFKSNKNLVCYNSEATYGAYDEEDLILAKSKARNLLKTMDRYVTLDDYKAGIDARPWVLFSKVADWQSDEDLVAIPHHIKVWIVNNTATNIPKELSNELEKEVYNKGIAGTQIDIMSAEYVDIPISVEFTLVGKGVYRTDILEEVKKTLKEYYDIKNCYFGQTVSIAETYQVIKQVSSDIKRINITMDEHNLTKIQFPRISIEDVTLVGNEYGEVKGERQTWIEEK